MYESIYRPPAVVTTRSFAVIMPSFCHVFHFLSTRFTTVLISHTIPELILPLWLSGSIRISMPISGES